MEFRWKLLIYNLLVIGFAERSESIFSQTLKKMYTHTKPLPNYDDDNTYWKDTSSASNWMRVLSWLDKYLDETPNLELQSNVKRASVAKYLQKTSRRFRSIFHKNCDTQRGSREQCHGECIYKALMETFGQFKQILMRRFYSINDKYRQMFVELFNKIYEGDDCLQFLALMGPCKSLTIPQRKCIRDMRMYCDSDESAELMYYLVNFCYDSSFDQNKCMAERDKVTLVFAKPKDSIES